MAVTIRKEDAPGTYLAEKDESGGRVLPASTRGVAVVGYFAKGPVNRRVRLRSQDELISVFGASDIAKFGYAWWVAYEALTESDEVYVIRVVNDTAVANDKLLYAGLAYNAGWRTTFAGVAELPTSSVVSHESLPLGKGYSPDKIVSLDGMTVANDGFTLASAVPGLEGNLIGFEIDGAKANITTITPTWSATPSTPVLNDLYEDTNGNLWRITKSGAVGTTQPAWPTTPYFGQQVTDGNAVWTSTTEIREKDVLGLSAKYPTMWWKILRLRVYQKPNSSVTTFTGLPIVDEFFFTLDDSVTTGGVAMQANRIINGKGRNLVYIRVGSDFSDGTIDMSEGVFDGSEFNTSGIKALLGGQVGVNSITHTSGLAQIGSGWELFKVREYSSWNLADTCVDPDLDATFSVSQKLNDVCATRMGAMYTAQVSKVTDIRKEQVEITAEPAFVGLKDASYGAFYAGFDRRRDPISGRLVWLPKSIEGLRAILKAGRMFNDAQAPAGAVVAVCKGIEQNVEFSKADCGYLYAKNINTSIKKPEGNVMWGQKTAQRTESKRDRINVRRILNKIGLDLEQIGDSLIWSNISPALMERLYTAVDRNLEQRSGEGYFDTSTKEAGKGYRVKVMRNPDNKNRLDVRVEVIPIDTLEWVGVEIVVTDAGVESVTEV
jgi:hypothetical protein